MFEAIVLDGYLGPDFGVSKPFPDLGVDYRGHFEGRGDDTVSFNFQVKSDSRFSVSPATFARWTQVVEREPVILVHIRGSYRIGYEVRFRVLSEWMVHHPGWPDELAAARPVDFDLGEFHSIDDAVHGLRMALEIEESRALRSPPSLWFAAKNPVIPVGFVGLFNALGGVSDLEADIDALEEARLSAPLGSTDQHVAATLNRFLRAQELGSGTFDSEHLQSWKSLVNRPRSPEAVHRERAEFVRFARATETNADGGRPRLPAFRWRSISSWRTFGAVFPRSLLLVERVLGAPGKFASGEVATAMAMAAAIAATGDPTTSSRAAQLLRRSGRELDSARPTTYEKYKVGREYRFSVAEAGMPGGQRAAIEFMQQNSRQWDLQVNREYYASRTDQTTARAVTSRLQSRRARDMNVAEVNQVLFERLPRKYRR